VDAEGWDEVIGTVAGDDHLLIISSQQYARQSIYQSRLERNARLMPQTIPNCGCGATGYAVLN